MSALRLALLAFLGLALGTVLALAWVGLVALACIAPLFIEIGAAQYG